MRTPRGAVVGSVAGLAWAGALRGWMALLVGPQSQVSWRTPVYVLIPGAVVGGLLGWAATLRRAAARPPRALRLVPAVFAVALVDPDIRRSLVTDGQGSGALIVVVTAVAGGHALSHHGWSRTRVASASLAGAGVATMTGMGTMAGPVTTRRGLAAALLGGSLMAVLCAGTALAYPSLEVVEDLP